jgi:2'-5' RNA ligase
LKLKNNYFKKVIKGELVRYFFCAELDDALLKYVKKIRFDYDRKLLHQDIAIVIAGAKEMQFNRKLVREFIADIIKSHRSIKVKTDDLFMYNNFLVLGIKENRKLLTLKEDVTRKGKYFDTSEQAPYIPIIKNEAEEETESYRDEFDDRIFGYEFFIRKFSVYILNGEETDKAFDFSV